MTDGGHRVRNGSDSTAGNQSVGGCLDDGIAVVARVIDRICRIDGDGSTPHWIAKGIIGEAGNRCRQVEGFHSIQIGNTKVIDAFHCVGDVYLGDLRQIIERRDANLHHSVTLRCLWNGYHTRSVYVHATEFATNIEACIPAYLTGLGIAVEHLELHGDALNGLCYKLVFVDNNIIRAFVHLKHLREETPTLGVLIRCLSAFGHVEGSITVKLSIVNGERIVSNGKRCCHPSDHLQQVRTCLKSSVPNRGHVLVESHSLYLLVTSKSIRADACHRLGNHRCCATRDNGVVSGADDGITIVARVEIGVVWIYFDRH